MATIPPKEVLEHMSWVVLKVILRLSTVAACVSGYGRREEDVCHVSFVCGAFSSLYARSSSVWPVCPAPSWLFYFTFCLWILTSPSYSHSLFDISFWVVSLSPFPSLSPSPSLSLVLSLYFFLHLFDALIVGWMTEAIRLFHPRMYTEQSCPVLCCWFSCSAHVKEKAECDSDAKVGGMGPGGWLNRLTVASAHSLLHGRYSDK